MASAKEHWGQLSVEEKGEARFEAWLSPAGMQFETSAAKAAYEARVMRLKDAIQLKKAPDRVPVLPLYTFLPAPLARVTNEAVMYDAATLIDAWKQFILQYEPDGYNTALLIGTGQALETLGYTLYRWPGHGVSPTSPYQYTEGEYMKPDEYDLLIQDPTDFWMRTYLPRIFTALAPLALLSPLTNMTNSRP